MAERTARASGTRKAGKSAGPTKKGAAKKRPAKESAAKRSGPRPTTPEQASGDSSEVSSPRPRRRSTVKAEARPAAPASQVAKLAASELLELTGKAAEGVTGLERTEDGWTVQVEVVEVRRIPDTTDVLALYEVQTDNHGSLQGYRRVQRYTRGSAGDS